MRILKYFLLLFLLFFIGLIVFVATEKPNYNVERSKIIKNPRSVVYNYVNDFNNWESFYSRISSDKTATFNTSQSTQGKGSFLFWDGNTVGNLKNATVKENDSIEIKEVFNGENSKIYIHFKDTIGGTKVTWKTVGKLDFKTKIFSFFSGGITSLINTTIDSSLENLNKSLLYELNTFNIKVNGVVTKKPTFYLKQSVLCREKSVFKNISIIIPKLDKFFTKNKLSKTGNPFVIYTKYDTINNLINLSVCYPVKDSIFISAGSDIQSGQLPYYTAIKTTLTGDYSHLKKALKKGIQYADKNTFIKNTNLQVIEEYSKTRKEVKNPSKWITQIYVPVYPKVIATKPITIKPVDSTTVKPIETVIEP